ncbi:DUF3545 family protein [Thalassotalea sp. G2M2-11]|uniref:DUF3545 family protein n=1 Tax=Thalassotalea sp. G2M2-11 TaxID=2787627 RepID=UPI0019CF6842|nr:DUF3545 family protein [Thalassotalea sp. G2M2-11]
MNRTELFDQDYGDEQLEFEHKLTAKSKSRKAKWREIEQIKEQRRLQRELAQYEQYSY